MSRAIRLVGILAVIVLVIVISVEPSGDAGRVTPWLPSFKGLNYGVPLTASGDWVGTAWLRDDNWSRVQPGMEEDLEFVQSHHLGRVIRLFVALDQLMKWDAVRGFVGFDAGALDHLNQALDLFDRHKIRVIAVLFDQEVLNSPGNFRFQALDGHHDAIRAGYLRAAAEFVRTIGTRSTIAALDLFNEAYSSLGTSGALARPPAPDPVSPGYVTATVHQFLRDLYASVKAVEPQIPLTVSDATLYWQSQPDLSLYDDVLDFYDVHVYDDHPRLGNLKRALDRPYIIGEAGAAVAASHYTNQAAEAGVIKSVLEQGREYGAQAVLVQSIANENVFPASRDRLTETGVVLSQFDEPAPAAETTSVRPLVGSQSQLVLFVTLLAVRSPSDQRRRPSSTDPGRETRWERLAQEPLRACL